MSKTLTEQWREGTLPGDCYYILIKNGHIRKDRTCFYSHTDEQCFCFTSNKDIQEVLEPVPSYDVVKKLQEQLKEVQQELQIRINDNADMYAKLCNALMQLEEANNTLKKIAIAMACDPSDIKVIIPEYCVEQDVLDNCNKYFEKWGVK